MDVLNFLWFSLVWRVNYYFCVIFVTTFIGHCPSFMQQGLDVDMEFLYCFQSNVVVSNVVSLFLIYLVSCHVTCKCKNCVSNIVS